MTLRWAVSMALGVFGCSQEVQVEPPATSPPAWGETLPPDPTPTLPGPISETPALESPSAVSTATAGPMVTVTPSPSPTSGQTSPPPTQLGESSEVMPSSPPPSATSAPTFASMTQGETSPPDVSNTPSPTPAFTPLRTPPVPSPTTGTPPPTPVEVTTTETAVEQTPSPTPGVTSAPPTPMEPTPTLVLSTPFACIPLPEGGLPLNLKTVQIQGDITVGGVPQLATTHAGFLQLETNNNERVVMDSATEGFYVTRLLPGKFDLIYHRNPAEGVPPQIPGNTNFKLAQGLRISGNQTYPVDIPTCQPRLALSVEADTGQGRGVVVAWGPSGDRTEVSDNRGVMNWIIPGTYDLRYEWKSDGPGIPRNVGADLALKVAVDGASDLNFPMKGVYISGSLTLDGQVLEGSSYGDVYLRKNGLGNAWLGRTDMGSFDTWVLPGTYTVRYQRVFGTEAPQNMFVDLPITVEVVEDGHYDIDLDVINLHLQVTVAGLDLRGGENSAALTLRSSRGDFVALGDINEGDLYTPMLVNPSDRYDLYYQYLAGDDIPHNENVKLVEGLVIVDDDVIYLDIPRVEIAGEVDLMGGPSPDPADLILTAGGDGATIGHVQDHTFAAWVVPGTYTLNWASRANTTQSPRNSLAPIAGPLEIEVDTMISVDVPRSMLSGYVQLDGAVIAAQGMGIYATRGNDRILLTTQCGDFVVPVLPGRYNLIYDNLYGEHVVPENRNHLVGCVEVPTPP